MRTSLDGSGGRIRIKGIGEMRESMTVFRYQTTTNIADGETNELIVLFTVRCAVKQVDAIAVRDEKAEDEFMPSYIAVAVNDERLRNNMLLIYRDKRLRVLTIQRDYQHNTMHINLAVDKQHIPPEQK